MTEHPEPIVPPYPADTLAKGWRFELDMEKFKRSDTWKLAKTGQVRAALLLLWAEAWQEAPCGTLPDDDTLLALTIDMADATFAKHRAVLRRGWERASDGRLYHETITARVLAMLDKRAKDAGRAAGRRARKAESDGSPVGVPTIVTAESRVTPGGVHHEFDTKHQAPSTKHQAPVEDEDSGTALLAAPPPAPIVNASPREPTAPPDFDGSNADALNGKAVVSIALAWELPEQWGVDAESLGFRSGDVLREAEKFRQYWTAGKGKGTRRNVKGWRQSWSNWLEKAAEGARR